MNPAIFNFLAVAIRILGAVTVIVLLWAAVTALGQARTGVYYVVREEARSRGLRLIGLAVLLIPVTVLLAAGMDRLAIRPIPMARATAMSPPSTRSPASSAPIYTPSSALVSDTPTPRPTATPLPAPTATPSPTRIPPTDLPPTLLTPIPSAVPAVETASFGPIQLGSGYVNYQLTGISNTFPRDTPVIHATFLVRNLNRNAIWTAAWYRDGKYEAGEPMLWTAQPNVVGHAFYGPTGGFRPGVWELRLYIEDRLQSKATFTILDVTSTPTVTPPPPLTPTVTQ